MPKFKKPLTWFIRAIIIIGLVSIYPFLLEKATALYSSIGQFDSNPQAIILYIDIRYPGLCPFRPLMRVWGDGLAFLEEDSPSSGHLNPAALHTLLDILKSEHFFIGWQADGPNPAGTALKIGARLKDKPVVEYTSGNLGPTLYVRIKETIQPALKPLAEQSTVDERIAALLKENENCNTYMDTK